MQKIIYIPTTKITDWNSFHRVFADIFSFPEYYGKNMNAWIDCMGDYVDEMTESTLVLRCDDGKEFQTKNPLQYTSLLECVSFLNTIFQEEKTSKQIILEI
jgi:RNAse (barnase) inhibitor barstar